MIITLTADASTAEVGALMQAITFENASGTPDTTVRTATFTLDDGDGGASTASAEVTITVAAVNDPPTLGALDGTTISLF